MNLKKISKLIKKISNNSINSNNYLLKNNEGIKDITLLKFYFKYKINFNLIKEILYNNLFNFYLQNKNHKIFLKKNNYNNEYSFINLEDNIEKKKFIENFIIFENIDNLPNILNNNLTINIFIYDNNVSILYLNKIHDDFSLINFIFFKLFLNIDINIDTLLNNEYIPIKTEINAIHTLINNRKKHNFRNLALNPNINKNIIINFKSIEIELLCKQYLFNKSICLYSLILQNLFNSISNEINLLNIGILFQLDNNFNNIGLIRFIQKKTDSIKELSMIINKNIEKNKYQLNTSNILNNIFTYKCMKNIDILFINIDYLNNKNLLYSNNELINFEYYCYSKNIPIFINNLEYNNNYITNININTNMIDINKIELKFKKYCNINVKTFN